MRQADPILVMGSVLWDIVGRAARPMKRGYDVPGLIRRVPGGVAMNIAMALAAQGMPVRLLSALGDDAEGRDLMAECARRGMDAGYVHISPSHRTDQYMAIEGSNGLIAAIADVETLEALAPQVVAPLHDGRLGRPDAPFSGVLVCEGNLPAATLAQMARDPALAAADIRLAPASPGKAARLAPFLSHPGATAYVNLIEAGILLGKRPKSAARAAARLVQGGLSRAVVTDGPNPCALAERGAVIEATPRAVTVRRVTGAGDVFMASHIVAETGGAHGRAALEAALDRVAAYISTEDPL
ncbi:MAG: PfkB family carbohydrate kinase [Pseudomonadota bacterium]